MGKSINCNKR